jgi:hypothetical protein
MLPYESDLVAFDSQPQMFSRRDFDRSLCESVR